GILHVETHGDPLRLRCLEDAPEVFPSYRLADPEPEQGQLHAHLGWKGQLFEPSDETEVAFLGSSRPLLGRRVFPEDVNRRPEPFQLKLGNDPDGIVDALPCNVAAGGVAGGESPAPKEGPKEKPLEKIHETEQ